jgi:hypothetical protein
MKDDETSVARSAHVRNEKRIQNFSRKTSRLETT